MELTFEDRETIGVNAVLAMLKPATPYGRRRAAKLAPFRDGAALKAELRDTAKAVATYDMAAYLRAQFVRFREIRGAAEAMAGAALTDVELFELKRFAVAADALLPLFDEVNAEAGFETVRFAPMTGALEYLDPAGLRDAAFKVEEAWSDRLGEIRRHKRDVEAMLQKDANRQEELKEKHRGLCDDERAEEEAVQRMLTEKLRPFAADFAADMEAVGRLDLLYAKAALARDGGGVEPAIRPGGVLMNGMRNPVVAGQLALSGAEFTALSAEFPAGVSVITGSNMGGKSVALKTLALNVCLAEMGVFPFAEAAETPLFEAIYLITGSREKESDGLSEFGGEVDSINAAVAGVRSGEKALVLADELARGTNPSEGAAIAAAVTQFFARFDSVAVFTTHYDGVAEHATAHYTTAGLSAGGTAATGVDAIRRHMDYGLVRVAAGGRPPRDAIRICRLMGMDAEILNAAEMNINVKKVTFGR